MVAMLSWVCFFSCCWAWNLAASYVLVVPCSFSWLCWGVCAWICFWIFGRRWSRLLRVSISLAFYSLCYAGTRWSIIRSPCLGDVKRSLTTYCTVIGVILGVSPSRLCCISIMWSYYFLFFVLEELATLPKPLLNDFCFISERDYGFKCPWIAELVLFVKWESTDSFRLTILGVNVVVYKSYGFCYLIINVLFKEIIWFLASSTAFRCIELSQFGFLSSISIVSIRELDFGSREQ